jgi:serine phosphatase RsbU (regulator of sigma subunit)
MLTTDTAQSSAGRPGTAAQSVHPAGAQPVPMQALAAAPAEQVPADAGDEPRGSRARLTAELAMQRHVTLELQRAILPLHDEPFDLPGLRAVVRYLPASSASRVGGDWYITAELPGRQVLLAIGDVAGHGLAAAAGMARLRGALAGLAITGAPPQQLVGWLNDLALHVGPEHTASVMAGYFDPVSHMLTWAQAGHPPPVLIRGPWARPLPQPDGVLLGASRSSYAAATVQLQPGDLLLMYSDGLVERRDRHLDEGLEILLQAVRQITDPERVISAALSALGSTDPEDDTCLVALQVLDPESGAGGQT